MQMQKQIILATWKEKPGQDVIRYLQPAHVLRRLAWLSAVVLATLSDAAHAASMHAVRRAVFKINVVSSEPSFSEPWKKTRAVASSGTGFYIGDGRILTNAHVVANASFITVLGDGASRPTPAFVRFIAHDSDLALIEPHSDEIFKGISPLTFGSLPKLRSPVATIGYPTGGEQLSITEGVVSRVEYRRYVHHGSASHLLVQVDSAINSGNSGGPVVQGRHVVGVAFQSYTRAENTGYIIPPPVVARFLKDVEDGRYDGHPEDGLTTADWTMLNPSARAFHGIKPEEGGIKITHVASWSSAYGRLKAGDIILAVDGQKVGVDGKVGFQGERVDFRVICDLKQIGETVRYTLVRDRGESMQVSVPVALSRPHHRPEHVYAKSAKYYVYGGLVFTTLTRSFLRTWGERWYRDAPLLLRFLDSYSTYQGDMQGTEDIIVLTKRLPDAVNAYASQNMYGVVRAVDERIVVSLPQFINELEQGKADFASIRFWHSDEPTVLSRSKVAARNKALNLRYGVYPDRWLSGPEVDGATTKVPASEARAAIGDNKDDNKDE